MTTTVADRPRIRVQPAPAFDPPYVDEPHAEAWASLVSQPPLLPADISSPPRPRQPPADPPQVQTAAQTRAAAGRFIHTCLEVLNGYRPVGHLRALSDPLRAAAVLDAMTRALQRVTRARGRTGRVMLRRMRVCEPRPGVAEITAVLATEETSTGGQRCWAAAFRLERRHGRWHCHVAHLL